MPEESIIKLTAKELDLKIDYVTAVAKLLEEDATIPFIARYRKEATGGMDEVTIISIRERLDKLRELNKRREAILKSLIEQDKLTPELEKKIMAAETLSKLEDIYLPYRPKKRTRGLIAKEKGLEPLAEKLFSQDACDIEYVAKAFINAEKKVNTIEDALQGARDIMAEWVNENSEAREKMRNLFTSQSFIASKVSKGKEKEAAKYRDYFDWSEPVKDAPSHRILAVLRGVDEGHLSFHILPEEEDALNILKKQFIKNNNQASDQVNLAITDSYKRLLSGSMETEMRTLYKKKADDEAIKVFAENVRELLLDSPLGQKSVLAIDPGQRTGCKIVCLDPQGSLLHNTTIYPLAPQNKTGEAKQVISDLAKKYKIQAIAVGNGTGGKESLAFCKSLELDDIIITMVNESGASVYSASKIARKEFPDHDVTVRGAVSIGRRLMDPLAELVKIDPKSIGVGQYQHDVDQKSLKKSLDDVVMSCVNAVGVEVNTASGRLLSYVSGLSAKVADNLVNHREKNGPFKAREDFKDISGMGPKSFEQCAGFLRIGNAENPLDASAVHPESYPVVKKMAADLSCSVNDLVSQEELIKKINLEDYVTNTTGMPTLKDIIAELIKPGRDPRKEFNVFDFSNEINEITDLSPGMRLPGVITNVTAFGAFVDVGVHQDGLVHISQLSDSYVTDPHKTVKVNQKVNVTVLDVDIDRKRISLSMKSSPVIGETAKKEKQYKEKPVRKNKNTRPGAGKQKKDKAPAPHSPFAGLAEKFNLDKR